MKKMKKMFVALIALTLLLGVNAMSVFAEDAYTYTITLNAGNKGVLKNEVKYEKRYGDTVSFDLTNVTVTDDRYYVKGVRLSGRDNNEVAPAFKVTGDADYVVAYGVKGDMVGYTVNYQDEDGNSLAPSDTFYGNIGDKPVVAYRYIENYVPQALALTKTLSSNESDNVFTFTYRQANPQEVNEAETETDGEQAQENAGDNQAGAQGNAGDNQAGAQGNAGDNQAGAEGNAEANEAGEEPEELVDLDDTETPAADIDLEKSKASKKRFPIVASVIIGAGALALLIALFLFVRKRTKAK